MAEKSLPWFRLYTETATDPKIDIIARDVGMDPLMVLGIWLKILCMASTSPRRGSLCITLQRRYSNADVTAMLRISNEQWTSIATSMVELEMLEQDEEGTYRIRNWNKRQFTSDDSQKRVEKSRKRYNAVTTPLQESYSNADVTPPDTDTDTESDSLNNNNKGNRQNIFVVYENEIGVITKTMADTLTQAAKEYPEQWIVEAMQEAARQNKRTWSYCAAILRNRKTGNTTKGKKADPPSMYYEVH